MYIQVDIPATLPLALIKIEEEGRSRCCLLGAAIKHPPIQLRAEESTQITITGPRSDVAAMVAQHIYAVARPATPPEIEIEHAIPAFMGLGSESMLGLGIAHTLGYFDGQKARTVAETAHLLAMSGGDALPLWAAHSGGLLLLDLETPSAPPLRRAEPAIDDKNAWGFVLIMPRVNASLDDEIEVTRQAALLDAAQRLDPQSGVLFNQSLWPAVEADDLSAFGAGLMTLNEMNQPALASANLPPLANEHAQSIFQVMAAEGAVAWGQSLTGHALFALARGARSTINIRKALRPIMTHESGLMLATIVDSEGIRLSEKKGAMANAFVG